MKNLIRVIKFAKPFRKTLIFVGFIMLVIATTKQFHPWISKSIVDGIEYSVDQELDLHTAFNSVVPLLLVLFIITVIGVTTNRISWHISEVLKTRMQKFLMEKAYNKLCYMDVSYFDKAKSGSVMAKLNRGVERITGQISSITIYFIPNILTAIIAIILLSRVRLDFVLLLIGVFIPYIIINALIIRKHKKIEDVWNALFDNNYGHFYEVLGSIRLLKIFNREEFEKDKMEKFYKRSVFLSEKMQRLWDWSLLKDGILQIWSWCLYVYSVYLALNGEISLGVFILLVQYTTILKEPLWNITWMFFEFRRSIIGAKDYFKIIDRKQKIKDRKNASVIANVRGRIEFQDVSFKYKKNKWVLKNINLEINPGEVVAFVGHSGEGKSTIVNLINRFYDPQKGKISIDGKNLRFITQNSLRENIGMVMQDSYLYAQTIEENLKYGNLNATTKQMVNATRAANAYEFIKDLSKGFKTKIGERGIKLSGGQKQRLSIARTILKNPPILILDEATSSLDSESEKLVQDAIWNLVSNRTTIIIAHRLATVQRADKIFVLKNGKIAEEGSHAELIKAKGIYEKMFSMQKLD